LHVLLFFATLYTMSEAGRGFFLNFLLDLVPRPLTFTTAREIWTGSLYYSVSGLAIVVAHEFGHYFACRYYRVDASLPFLIPFPNLLGTMGAFIKIRSPIPHRRALFDIGVAGPFAGFVVALALLVLGVAWSRVVKFPQDFSGIEFGEPLAFKAAVWMFWGDVPDGYTINLHPMGFAAWAGCFLTAMNLLPIWQLDGGHLSYAVFRRRSTWVTLAGVLACVLFAVIFSWNWAIWAAMLIAVMAFFGPHHFPTLNDDIPLGRTRIVLAILAAVVLVVCFMPVPFEFTSLLGTK
jgi:membrane-associated protease RseP (regulator of RpoE activity)